MPQTSTTRKISTRGLGLLTALVWLVYANSLQNPYHFDDFHVIPENPAVRGISDVPSFFTDPTKFSILPGNRDYRPVFLTSMAISWSLGGGAVLPFHLVSVAVHTGSALLLFFIFRWFFSTGGGERGSARARTDWAALAGAGIFALHPLATEPVNYISSQSVLLAAFFYLLSFYLFLKVYSNQGNDSKVALRAQRFGSYAAFFLGLLSKPIAITLPANLLLWELLLGKEAGDEATDDSLLPRLWKRLRKHLPYFAIALVYMVIRQTLLPRPFGTPARSILSHYLTQTKALVLYYLKLALVPLGLNVDPEFPVSQSFVEGSVLASFLVMAAIALLLWRFRRNRVAVFWTLWFPVCLLVTTYLSILFQVVNDHRPYLSVAGISALAGLAFGWLRERFPLRIADLSIGPRVGRALVTTLLISICGALALLTVNRNRVWASDFALWEDAALNGGTWRAHMNYGLALENEGRSEEAFQQFKTAVDMFPGAYSHINLGLAYLRRDDLQQGLAHLRKAVELWPDLPEAHLFLARGLEENGQTQDAENELLTAIRFRPNYLKGYKELAAFHERQNQPRKAYAAYQKLLELDPSQAWARPKLDRLAAEGGAEQLSPFERGLRETAVGNYSEAVSALTDAYARLPKNPELLFNLAFSNQMLGNRGDAIRYYEELLKLSPKHVKGNFNLGYAYMEGASHDELSRGAALFRMVLELEPGYSEALFRLASVNWKLGDETEARRYDQLYLEQGTHDDLKSKSRSRLSQK